MPQNFLGCDREQVLLMPPSLQEWLSQNHLGWFVLGAVEQMDLAAFYAAYRADGHGRAAHEPAMMVGLLIYAYARGQRSSRRIERSCIERARRLDLLAAPASSAPTDDTPDVLDIYRNVSGSQPPETRPGGCRAAAAPRSASSPTRRSATAPPAESSSSTAFCNSHRPKRR